MEIKRGDIILVHSHTFTGRMIQFGMNVERWRKLDFNPFWKHINNHAGICVMDGMIAEALSSGIVVRSIEEAYGNDSKRTLTIYRPNWKKMEWAILPVVALQYKGTKYQFINFLQYIPKIFFGIWLGTKEKRAEDKLYCTEYVSLIIHKIRDWLFKEYWKSSPSDLQEYCEQNITKIGIWKQGNWV